MLGRKNYTQKEIDHGRAAVDQQLAAYKRLVSGVASTKAQTKASSAVDPFEALFSNNLALVLDRYLVHRLAGPKYEGKDGNPLNELRPICISLITNNGVMLRDNMIKLPPDRSVVRLDIGDSISLTENEFERLSEAVFTELERRFLDPAPLT